MKFPKLNLEVINYKTIIKKTIFERHLNMDPINVLQEFCNLAISKPSLYNPKTSLISWDITSAGNSVHIYLAKTLNPNNVGVVKKGEKRYDHEKPAHFSLSVDECFQILEAYPKLIKGIYENPKENDPKYKKQFSLQHFRFDTSGSKFPSRFILETSKDKNGNIIPSLKLTLIPPKSFPKTQVVSYSFRISETKRFITFIETFCKNSDFLVSTITCIQSLIRQAIAKSKNSSGNTSYKKSYESKTQDTSQEEYDYYSNLEEESNISNISNSEDNTPKNRVQNNSDVTSDSDFEYSYDLGITSDEDFEREDMNIEQERKQFEEMGNMGGIQEPSFEDIPF